MENQNKTPNPKLFTVYILGKQHLQNQNCWSSASSEPEMEKLQISLTFNKIQLQTWYEMTQSQASEVHPA